jgi:hypothetical protein
VPVLYTLNRLIVKQLTKLDALSGVCSKLYTQLKCLVVRKVLHEYRIIKKLVKTNGNFEELMGCVLSKRGKRSVNGPRRLAGHPVIDRCSGLY